jgi:chromatin remodeling complex protein RSC6
MAKKKAKKAGKKRKPNAAFMKAMTPSGPLAAVVGSSAMPRTEVTKKIWGYIKRNGLQDKKNRRMINADDKLKAVFQRQGPGVDVRDDQAGQQAPEVKVSEENERAPRGALFISGGRT